MSSWAEELAAECGTTVAQAQAMLDGATMAVEPKSLYCSEAELARLVLGNRPKVDWRQAVAAWELEGFPGPDPTTGMRFWPAVSSWLRKRHGVDDGPALGVDGEEVWK